MFNKALDPLPVLISDGNNLRIFNRRKLLIVAEGMRVSEANHANTQSFHSINPPFPQNPTCLQAARYEQIRVQPVRSWTLYKHPGV